MIPRITNALGENMLNRSSVNESGLYGAAISSSLGHTLFGVSFCCFFAYKTDSKILNLIPRIGDFINIINSLKNYMAK